MSKYFEIVDNAYGKHRFNYDDYWYAEHPSIRHRIDVFKMAKTTEEEDKDDGRAYLIFWNPVMVGHVDEDTTLSLPCREIPLLQCKRCGMRQHETT